MSGPGYVFRDSGLTPEPIERADPINYNEIASTSQEPRTRRAELAHEAELLQTPPDSTSSASKDSSGKIRDIIKELTPDSHDIAEGAPNLNASIPKGDQHGGAIETHDVGWHQPEASIPDPLLEGISNGKLFARIRRFNKDVFAVQSVPAEECRGLDLNEAWDTKYNNDKITLHLQRLYLTIILGASSLVKHVSRLRSWKETKRTGAFCVVYTIAWLFDLLIPLFLGTLIATIASPKARELLFPPAPRSLVRVSTGGIQKPQAGQLGTDETLTGAPEKIEGEAAEEEAAKFVSNVRHLAQKTVGMHDKEENQGDPLEGKVPKPIRKGINSIKDGGAADGHATKEKGTTEKPMEEILWKSLSPESLEPIIKKLPHVLGEIVDNYERFANAISPTPPFTQLSYLRIDGVLLPLFVGSFFISAYMVYKVLGLAVGFVIFGDPIISPAMEWLNRNYPHWAQLLEPKNNILRGVPTNNQLALTLLRIGEVNHSPIPPVPNANQDEKKQNMQVDIDDIPLSATNAEKIAAVQPSDMEKAHSHEEGNDDDEHQPKHKHLSKVTRIFKSNAKAVVATKLTADKARAAVGNEKAKGHLGVLPKEKELVYAGPADFKARLHGKTGWVHITHDKSPKLLFTSQDPEPSKGIEDKAVEVSLSINELTSLRRASAFANNIGQKAAEVSGDRELLGSVEVEDRTGKAWRFTALPERDDLFNRLVAMGPQKWQNL